MWTWIISRQRGRPRLPQKTGTFESGSPEEEFSEASCSSDGAERELASSPTSSVGGRWRCEGGGECAQIFGCRFTRVLFFPEGTPGWIW